MEKYFTLIDDVYRKKHYPNGFFSAAQQTSKNLGIFCYVFAVILLIPFLPMMLWGFGTGISAAVSGGGDDVMGSVFVGGIGFAFTAAAVFFIVLAKHSGKKTSHDWLDKYTTSSHYPQSVIHEFERQVLSSEAYLMYLDGKVNTAFPGLLTENFICVNTCVIRKSDIHSVFLIDVTENVLAGDLLKTVRHMDIAILSNQKTCIRMTAKPEAIQLLIPMLAQDNPGIGTGNSRVVTEQEFVQYYNAFMEQ